MPDDVYTAASMYADFIAASHALLNPPKTATANTGKFSYAYAPLPDILDTVRPILAEHGFALTQPVTGSVGVETILLHRSGQSIRSGVVSLPAGDDPQKAGGVITYLRRYQLCGLLGIAADEDDDAQNVRSGARMGKAGSGAAKRGGGSSSRGSAARQPPVSESPPPDPSGELSPFAPERPKSGEGGGEAPSPDKDCRHENRHDDEIDGKFFEVCDDCGAKRPVAA